MIIIPIKPVRGEKYPLINLKDGRLIYGIYLGNNSLGESADPELYGIKGHTFFRQDSGNISIYCTEKGEEKAEFHCRDDGIDGFVVSKVNFKLDGPRENFWRNSLRKFTNENFVRRHAKDLLEKELKEVVI